MRGCWKSRSRTSTTSTVELQGRQHFQLYCYWQGTYQHELQSPAAGNVLRPSPRTTANGAVRRPS